MTRIITERCQITGRFWRAYDDDLGADCSPYGVGDTEAEAIEDLREKLESLESEK